MPRAKRRDPLPGETIYGGRLVHGRIRGGRLEYGPRAFFTEMGPHWGLLCDPDQPIEHKSRVVVTVGPSRFDGTVTTKHPARAKSLAVRLSTGHTLRRVEKKLVARVMSESRSAEYYGSKDHAG